uniref:Putative secreted protein n=1 Tax=Anopheles darlingi TaxID=43151 RepID=A0A2M4D6M3_ANODA
MWLLLRGWLRLFSRTWVCVARGCSLVSSWSSLVVWVSAWPPCLLGLWRRWCFGRLARSPTRCQWSCSISTAAGIGCWAMLPRTISSSSERWEEALAIP